MNFGWVVGCCYFCGLHSTPKKIMEMIGEVKWLPIYGKSMQSYFWFSTKYSPAVFFFSLWQIHIIHNVVLLFGYSYHLAGQMSTLWLLFQYFNNIKKHNRFVRLKKKEFEEDVEVEVEDVKIRKPTYFHCSSNTIMCDLSYVSIVVVTAVAAGFDFLSAFESSYYLCCLTEL